MNAEQIRVFLRAGRAVFTLQSVSTGTHFTYRVRLADPEFNQRPALLVSVLTAPDTWTYMGMLEPVSVQRTRGSKVADDAPSFRALNWFLGRITRGDVPLSCVFRHEGRCGRCQRALTTPASIDTGLGPYCAEELGVPHQTNQ